MDKSLKKRVEEVSQRIEKLLQENHGKKLLDSFTCKWYGYTIDQKFANVDDAIKALYDSKDKNICGLALVAISVLWTLDYHSEHVARIKYIASTESDDLLRVAALRSLGLIFEKTNNREIGRLFTEIVKDESKNRNVRWAAYYGLGLLREHKIEESSPFPESIDWDFVNDFLK